MTVRRVLVTHTLFDDDIWSAFCESTSAATLQMLPTGTTITVWVYYSHTPISQITHPNHIDTLKLTLLLHHICCSLTQ